MEIIGGQHASNLDKAIDGILNDLNWQTHKHYRWIEITLPDFILIPRIKVFTKSVSIFKLELIQNDLTLLKEIFDPPPIEKFLDPQKNFDPLPQLLGKIMFEELPTYSKVSNKRTVCNKHTG